MNKIRITLTLMANKQQSQRQKTLKCLTTKKPPKCNALLQTQAPTRTRPNQKPRRSNSLKRSKKFRVWSKKQAFLMLPLAAQPP